MSDHVCVRERVSREREREGESREKGSLSSLSRVFLLTEERESLESLERESQESLDRERESLEREQNLNGNTKTVKQSYY